MSRSRDSRDSYYSRDQNRTTERDWRRRRDQERDSRSSAYVDTRHHYSSSRESRRRSYSRSRSPPRSRSPQPRSRSRYSSSPGRYDRTNSKETRPPPSSRDPREYVRSRSPARQKLNERQSTIRESTSTVTTKSEDVKGTVDEAADPEDAMAAMMGFGGFGSTKNTKVQGNGKGGAIVGKAAQTTKYRQYMNRQGGFNRALEE